MTLTKIYDEFTPGSKGFVKAVQTHCGFDLSDEEIERIADRAASAEVFQRIWENDDSWTDASSPFPVACARLRRRAFQERRSLAAIARQYLKRKRREAAQSP